jgi:hypothetical protein
MNTFHFPSSYVRIISLKLFEIKYAYHLQFKYLQRKKKLQAAEELSLLRLTMYQSIADNIMKIRLFVYLDFTHLPLLLPSDGLGVRYNCSSGSTLLLSIHPSLENCLCTFSFLLSFKHVNLQVYVCCFMQRTRFPVMTLKQELH